MDIREQTIKRMRDQGFSDAEILNQLREFTGYEGDTLPEPLPRAPIGNESTARPPSTEGSTSSPHREIRPLTLGKLEK